MRDNVGKLLQRGMCVQVRPFCREMSSRVDDTTISGPPCTDPTMAAFVDTVHAAGGVVVGHSLVAERVAGWVVLIGGCSRDTNPGARTGIDLDVLSAFSILVGWLYSCKLSVSLLAPRLIPDTGHPQDFFFLSSTLTKVRRSTANRV